MKPNCDTTLVVDFTTGTGNASACAVQVTVVNTHIQPDTGRITLDFFSPTVNTVKARVTSGETRLGVYYDPLLAQQEMQTLLLNETLRFGFAPPSSKTTE